MLAPMVCWQHDQSHGSPVYASRISLWDLYIIMGNPPLIVCVCVIPGLFFRDGSWWCSGDHAMPGVESRASHMQDKSTCPLTLLLFSFSSGYPNWELAFRGIDCLGQSAVHRRSTEPNVSMIVTQGKGCKNMACRLYILTFCFHRFGYRARCAFRYISI